MARVEHNGKWAEISEKQLTWGQRNTIRSAATKDFWTVFAPAVVTTVVTAWSEAGDPHDAGAWEDVDPDFADRVFGEALAVYKRLAEQASVNPTVEPSES